MEISKKRNIIFKRDKKFNGSLVPVFIFMDEKNIGKVKNGKEFVFLIDEEEHIFHIAWSVSTDPKNTYRYSKPLMIDKSKDEIKVRIKNDYSIKSGSVFELIIIDSYKS